MVIGIYDIGYFLLEKSQSADAHYPLEDVFWIQMQLQLFIFFQNVHM